MARIIALKKMAARRVLKIGRTDRDYFGIWPGKLRIFCDPDRTRTGDLLRDREAC